jgi:hypothetical protein
LNLVDGLSHVGTGVDDQGGGFFLACRCEQKEEQDSRDCGEFHLYVILLGKAESFSGLCWSAENLRKGVESVREHSSVAPSGLGHFPLSTHGLRRGLHSNAASRL